MVNLLVRIIKHQRGDAFVLLDMVIGMMIMSIIMNGLINWGVWLDQEMMVQSDQFDSAIHTLNIIQSRMIDGSVKLNDLNLCEYQLFNQPIVVVCE